MTFESSPCPNPLIRRSTTNLPFPRMFPTNSLQWILPKEEFSHLLLLTPNQHRRLSLLFIAFYFVLGLFLRRGLGLCEQKQFLFSACLFLRRSLQHSRALSSFRTPPPALSPCRFLFLLVTIFCDDEELAHQSPALCAPPSRVQLCNNRR